MSIRAAGVTWANVVTWAGGTIVAIASVLVLVYQIGQWTAHSDANHAETLAKLAKIEAALPPMQAAAAAVNLQIQHITDTCCKGQTAKR